MAKRPIKYRLLSVQGWCSPITLMTERDGYCMVRHKGAIPFVMSRTEWDRLPDSPPEGVKVCK